MYTYSRYFCEIDVYLSFAVNASNFYQMSVLSLDRFIASYAGMFYRVHAKSVKAHYVGLTCLFGGWISSIPFTLAVDYFVPVDNTAACGYQTTGWGGFMIAVAIPAFLTTQAAIVFFCNTAVIFRPFFSGSSASRQNEASFNVMLVFLSLIHI